MTALLQEKTPCEIEGRNFKRHYTEPAIGKVYRISFEVQKDTWDACELIPKSATVKGVLWWESEGEDFKPEVKAEPKGHVEESCVDSECPIHGTKGPHGAYWHGLFKHGFYNQLDLMEVLDTPANADACRLALHDQLRTKSLTLVSPGEFEKWCEDNHLISLVTLSRQVTAKMKETQ